ncbi:MAG TPA: PAS domain-containing protein, partial [Acidobacteriota bacterium]|nr:PAS domain-containing protein [Acidobacteriota bacterium]
MSRVRDGVFIEVNESFERMSGYRREDVIGRSSFDLSLWSDTLEDRTRLAETLRTRGSVRDFPVAMRTKQGELGHYLMSAETLEYAGELCAVVITRDVTESERVQQELHASEERYRTLFDKASDAVFL